MRDLRKVGHFVVDPRHMALVVVDARTACTTAQLAGILVASLVADEAVVVPRVRLFVLVAFLLLLRRSATLPVEAFWGSGRGRLWFLLACVRMRAIAVLAANRGGRGGVRGDGYFSGSFLVGDG